MLRTFVEGALDFSDEDIEIMDPAEVQKKIQTYIERVDVILIKARQGLRLQEGTQATIIGCPNVGKSSLLNRLAGKDSAIVTTAPGTTRDMVTEDILIGGIPLRLTDTAGLRQANNEAEQEGIRRARQASINADIVLCVVEQDQDLGEVEQTLLSEMTENNHVVILHNKIDLMINKPKHKIINNNNLTEIFISAKTGEGIDMLLEHLNDFLGVNDLREDVFVARTRHVNALEKAKLFLEQALNVCDKSKSELLAEELRMAQHMLGEITGEYSADDLLGEIFSRFCIGK